MKEAGGLGVGWGGGGGGGLRTRDPARRIFSRKFVVGFIPTGISEFT